MIKIAKENERRNVIEVKFDDLKIPENKKKIL